MTRKPENASAPHIFSPSALLFFAVFLSEMFLPLSFIILASEIFCDLSVSSYVNKANKQGGEKKNNSQTVVKAFEMEKIRPES